MKSKVMLSVLLLTCMALNVNLAWSATGESHQWTTYSDWGGSDTKSWLRNNNANLPTFKYTPTYAVSKVVLNVRQSNPTGSNSIEVTIGGSSFGTKVSSLSGTTAYDITFEGTTAMSGEIVITCTNNSGSGTGKGTFYLNSITLYESGVTYTDNFLQQAGTHTTLTCRGKRSRYVPPAYPDSAPTYSSHLRFVLLFIVCQRPFALRAQPKCLLLCHHWVTQYPMAILYIDTLRQ